MNERSIFLEALEITAPAERAAFLDRACNGAADLRKGVEDLLAANARSGTFMRSPAGGDDTADHRPSEGPGSRVGPYKLLQEIGEGGMGVVYMAEQEEPVRRKVALKIIKPGMDSKQVVARFEAERQALGMMDHPNIAKVFDAGTTDSGRPYFVMELIKGMPITEYCDAAKLTPRERLELFVPVCQAVQHAHQKGIIHRDLKPSNVLVGLYDGRPVPKVIDFGVAKAIGQRLTEASVYTEVGSVIGTLEYMSPEQAELNNLDIDTRSDIYALGVILYQLLTGTVPFTRQDLQAGGFAEMLRIIKEKEPPRPSTRLSTSRELPSVADLRRTEPSKLPGVVRGELDWIVMKALEKDRTRRYDTATGLAKDVQRYLSGETVEACPPTLGYRLRKAYRRNRAAVLTGGAFALLLAVGVLVASLLAVRATSAERTAQQEREAAEAAGRSATDERDRTRVALNDLTRLSAVRRAEQYGMTLTTLPIAWESGNVTEARRLHAAAVPAAGEADLRNFEWRFWDRQLNQERSSARLPLPLQPDDLEEPPYWVMSRDGSRVAAVLRTQSATDTARRVNLVRVWDTASQKLLRSHELPDEDKRGRNQDSFALTLSTDGKRLAVEIDDSLNRPFDGPPQSQKRFQILDVESGKVLLEHRADGRNDSVRTNIGILSPTGRACLTCQSMGDFPTVRTFTLHDLEAGCREVAKIAGVQWANFSPDGSKVLGWNSPGESTPTVWDATTGKELRTLGTASVTGWVCSPDGTRLYGVAMRDRKATGPDVVNVLDVSTGERLPDIKLPEDQHSGIPIDRPSVRSISPDGSRLVIGRPKASQQDMQEFVVLDTRERRVLFVLSEAFSWRAVSRTVRFTPDGKRLVIHSTTNNTIGVYDSTTGRLLHSLRGHTGQVQSLALTPDGQRVRSVESDGTLKEWSLHTGKTVRIECKGQLNLIGAGGLEVSADGERLMANTGRATGTVCVWNSSGGKDRQFPYTGLIDDDRLQGGLLRTGLSALSADGSRVAMLMKLKGADTELSVWDVASGNALLRHSGLYVPFSLALSSDGSRVAVFKSEAQTNAEIVVLDVKTGEARYSIPVSTDRAIPRDLQFSPDGTRLSATLTTFDEATGFLGNKHSLVVWSLAEPHQRVDIPLGTSASSSPTALWSPDSRRIAIATGGRDRAVTLYDAATGQPGVVLDIGMRGGRIPTGARPGFSPDSLRIAVPVETPAGRFVKVLDTHTGHELLSLRSEQSVGRGLGVYPHLVSFTADGNRLREYVVKNVPGTGRSSEHVIDVTTWDATPRESEKK